MPLPWLWRLGRREGAAPPDARQKEAARTFAGKAPLRQPQAKPVPLLPRERALQMLNRFTFGPRPGDLEQVLAMGPEAWFEQQLNPGTIPDAASDRRLNDFPTLRMTPAQALQLFPDREHDYAGGAGEGAGAERCAACRRV